MSEASDIDRSGTGEGVPDGPPSGGGPAATAGAADGVGAGMEQARQRQDEKTVTVVHVLRHGEVDNPEGVLYGRLPGYHLSELGRQMAERVAEHLTERDITHVAASPLERAQETAAPISKTHGLSTATDRRLIEAANIFEGKTFGVGDGALRKPGNWQYLRNPFRPSWGEPYVDLAVRMRAALDAARDAAYGHEAVCVSHQLPIWILRSHVERRRLWHDPRRRECTLASLTSFSYLGDRLVSVGYTEPALDLVPAHLRAGANRVKGAGGHGA